MNTYPAVHVAACFGVMNGNVDMVMQLKEANAVADFVTAANLSPTVELKGRPFIVRSCMAQDLRTAQKVAMMDILRDNMRAMYESAGWGWQEVEKRKEVFNKRSRFLYICAPETEEIKAYAVFRFEWDDEDEPEYPVVYCYELQVLQSAQKMGAGLVLMKMLQDIAKHLNFRKTCLTCFKANTAAMNFYKKAGFVVDTCSPSNYGELDECYEILSDAP